MTEPPTKNRNVVLNMPILACVVGAFVVFFVTGLRLRAITGWPDQYGWHCRSGCYIAELWRSPALLGRGMAADLLFAHLWSAPVLAIFFTSVLAINRRRKK